MNLKILHSMARSVTVELEGTTPYETAEFEIWLNEVLIRTENKVVFILNGLKPDCQYQLVVKSKAWQGMLSFQTKTEACTLNVRQFGAKGDGVTDDTRALQAAILCCPPTGRVWIPKGQYQFTNLFLKSHLIVELDKEAVLTCTAKRGEFPVLPGVVPSYNGESEYNFGSWEGNPLDSMASIITGMEVEDVVICGEGIIDGGGDFTHWWVSQINTIPPYRPRMIFLNRCKEIVIQGITVQNSPSWNIHPYFSSDIKIYGIHLISPPASHNTDGIDPESCTNVEIVGVHFSVGDDCIALKSGKIYMGRKYQTPSRKIYIRHCLMEKGHGAVTIGSEIAGGVQEVFVSDCIFRETDRGLRVKTRRGRGKDSVIDGIHFSNVEMDRVKSPFVINCFYYCDPDGRTEYVGNQEPKPVDERTPVVKNLEFTDIVCRDAQYTGICIYGLPEQKIESVTVKRVSISFHPEAGEGISAMMLSCPPTSRLGVFAKNIKKLTLADVRLDGAVTEYDMTAIDEYQLQQG